MVEAKIAVVTHGRFHSFDLAEQLQAAGRLAAVYTGYPRFKLHNTRVDQSLIHSFPWFHTLELGLMRVPHMPRRVLKEVAWKAGRSLDAHAARTLPDCNVVSAPSGGGLRVGAEVQRRGGVYVCDRGSTHIRWVERTLRDEYAKLGLPWPGIDPRAVAREEAEYRQADAITLPSQFTMRSFVEMGVPREKLRLVPYGVNLTSYRRSTPTADNFRVLFVGQLSVRKGIHYLLEAFRRADLPNSELVLVGSAFPETATLLKRHPIDRVTLTGTLPREGVVREMSRASVLVLPSLEEGLAMVQAQALACGCPVIATTHAGAEDLFEDGREGFIVEPRDIDALAERLTRLHRDRDLRGAMSVAAEARVRQIGGWDAYGRASVRIFDDLLAARSSSALARAAAR
jgi:alpha-maltose-1-phosphate synthase